MKISGNWPNLYRCTRCLELKVKKTAYITVDHLQLPFKIKKIENILQKLLFTKAITNWYSLDEVFLPFLSILQTYIGSDLSISFLFSPVVSNEGIIKRSRSFPRKKTTTKVIPQKEDHDKGHSPKEDHGQGLLLIGWGSELRRSKRGDLDQKAPPERQFRKARNFILTLVSTINGICLNNDDCTYRRVFQSMTLF